MAQDSNNPASGLLEGYSKIMTKARDWLGDSSKTVPKKNETDTGKLPAEWEAANKRSQQQSKSDPKLGGAKKAAKKKVQKRPVAKY